MSKSPTEDLVPVEGKKPFTILQQGQFDWWETSAHGMIFKPGTPQEVWLGAMESLLNMHEGSIMTAERALQLAADAMNFGEAEYNEEFAQAIDGTRQALGLSPKTLANAKWVYGKIAANRRRDGLTLAHYSVIAPLPEPEQDKLIAEVIEGHLTVNQLKTEVADRYPKTKRGKERKGKADKANELTISTMAEAKAALTLALNYLKANEEQITDAWEPLLKDGYLLYRRHWMTGHKR